MLNETVGNRHACSKRRKPNRFKGFNYSQAGFYFVTICTKDRVHWFGEIENGQMILNQYGELARTKWLEILKHFKFVRLDAWIVMPNHIHGIITIDNERNRHACSLQKRQYQKLPIIIGSYKSVVTKSIHDIMMNNNFHWQKSYYDHIIRDEESLNQLRQYVLNNPILESLPFC